MEEVECMNADGRNHWWPSLVAITILTVPLNPGPSSEEGTDGQFVGE